VKQCEIGKEQKDAECYALENGHLRFSKFGVFDTEIFKNSKFLEKFE
jgi:hypothetical protein